MPSTVPAGGLCLFGGTFDPVHEGHLAIARAATGAAGVARVLFVPCWQSPHKAGRPATPAAHRLRMLELALAGEPWAAVSDWELRRPEPSYSWQTAEHFQAGMPPGTSLSWLMGADQWAALDRWARPERLAELLTFVVFPRAGWEITPRPGFRHVVIDVVHPASATAIRADVAAGRAPRWLPAPVASYVAEHGLYRG